MWQVVDLSAGEGGHLLGQFTHLMAFGHLVEDLHPLPLFRRVFQRQLNAAHGIADVNEGAGLSPGSMNGERIADGGLHQEAG